MESSHSVNTEVRNAAPTAAKRRRRKGRAGRRSRLPKKLLRVTTYERLGEYLEAFAAGHFHLLILVGTGGLAKSRSVRAVLSGTGCWIEGNATPFDMYVKLYRHRDEFVVIDDVDALYADRSGVRLLKCLCQTEEEKAVAWHSDARSLERQRIPREFTTKSRVVIIANDWQTLNKDASEIRRLLSQWLGDEENTKEQVAWNQGQSRPEASLGPPSTPDATTAGPGEMFLALGTPRRCATAPFVEFFGENTVKPSSGKSRWLMMGIRCSAS